MNSKWISLAVFLIVAFGVSSALGVLTLPGEWYAGLNKPPFNPPNWIFGPVWTVLYLFIGVAGWLVWLKEPRGPAMAVWAGQMLLNWIWSPIFFRLQSIWLAAVVIVVIFLLIVAFIALARRIDMRAAWLFVPYAAWVGFASVLNISIGLLN